MSSQSIGLSSMEVLKAVVSTYINILSQLMFAVAFEALSQQYVNFPLDTRMETRESSKKWQEKMLIIIGTG